MAAGGCGQPGRTGENRGEPGPGGQILPGPQRRHSLKAAPSCAQKETRETASGPPYLGPETKKHLGSSGPTCPTGPVCVLQDAEFQRRDSQPSLHRTIIMKFRARQCIPTPRARGPGLSGCSCSVRLQRTCPCGERGARLEPSGERLSHKI